MSPRARRIVRRTTFAALVALFVVGGALAANWRRLRVAFAVHMIDRGELCFRCYHAQVMSIEPVYVDEGIEVQVAPVPGWAVPACPWSCPTPAARTLDRVSSEDPSILLPYVHDERLAGWWATPKSERRGGWWLRVRREPAVPREVLDQLRSSLR